MYIRIIVCFLVFMCTASPAQSKEWTFGEAAKELIARFPKWYAYDQISSDSVVFVPLDQDVVTKPVEGGMKRIAENPDIYLHGITTNGANTIRGELRIMKKDGKHDVFDTFKGLMDKQKVGASSENISSGDRSEGVYSFVYVSGKDEVTYESVINVQGAYAVSYSLTARNDTQEEKLAGAMVASYMLLWRCAADNFGDTNCVVQDPKL